MTVLASTIDRLYRSAIKKSRPVRIVAGFLSRLGLALLSTVKRFRVSNDRSLTDWYMLLGTYERGTVAFLERTVQPGMTVADIGAHVGYFTRRLSRLVGSAGSVVSFEAHPATYDLLDANCRKLTNVSIVNAAVTDHEGEATLYASGGSTGSNSLISTRSDYARSHRVRALQLDRYLDDTVLDLVKIDVEGAELEVLEGMRHTLEISPDIAIIIELFPPVWHEHPGGPRVLLDRLESRGFEPFVIEDDGSLKAVEEWSSFNDLLLSIPKYVNILGKRPRPTAAEDVPV